MSDLDKMMKRMGFHPLPLSRVNPMVGAIFELRDGNMRVIRNPGECFPVDLLQNTRANDVVKIETTFEFNAKGFLNIFSRWFGKGGLKPELDAKSIHKARLTLLDLSEDEMIIGRALDWLEMPEDKGGMPFRCRRHVFFEKHLTITDALKVGRMLFEFLNVDGVQVKLQEVDLKDLLSLGGEVGVSITKEGLLYVSTPSYIGYAFYTGKTWQQRINEMRGVSPVMKSHAFAEQCAGPQSVRAYAVTDSELEWLVQQSREEE